MTGISNVIAIAAGGFHTMAVTADKTLWTWGDNADAQLGNNSTVNSSIPVHVTSLSNVTAIAGGAYFSLAVASNGSVYAWGINDYGQLGTNTGGTSITIPTLVAGISNAVLLAPGSQSTHTLAANLQQGTNYYFGWGDSTYGQVGNGAVNTNVYTPAEIPIPTACQECIQMGTNGFFTAQCTGTLTLYFNDDQYTDNSGAYTATVFGVASEVIVVGTNSTGIAIGTVSNGVTYSYIADGFVTWSPSGDKTDPNGDDPSGHLIDCDSNHGSTHYNGEGRCGFPCRTAICYSLVGKIQ